MNKFEARSRASYDRMADGYDSTPEGRFCLVFQRKILAAISSFRGGKVLDVACGNGTLLKMIADVYNIDGYGADISEGMIANAKRLHPKMDFTVAPCNKLPFCNDYFNLITVCCAYHHFPNVDAFAKEASRLLKHGGTLHIAEIYYPSPVRVILNPFVPFSQAGDVKFYSPAQIIKTFTKHGLKHIYLQIDGHQQILGFQKAELIKVV